MSNEPLPHDIQPADGQADAAPASTGDAGIRPGFSAAELSAAARVFEHQVQRATARHAPPPV